jgi:hypothetical protein
MTNGTAQGQPQNLIASIRSVRIQNFRSVRDLTIDLAPDVTVFFGVNAAGKTALLEALAIGLGAIVARVPKATGLSFANHGDIRVPWKDRPAVEETKGAERPFSRVLRSSTTLRPKFSRCVRCSSTVTIASSSASGPWSAFSMSK